uniref:Uncharacterized protein n=1 Tax=Nelumbo nucifera TaxID=4432 RepID=A0A822YR51_NELNU|nr:TPA_asm: hypothetical protein HUJ06_012720 [Nelumbo nucifera]
MLFPTTNNQGRRGFHRYQRVKLGGINKRWRRGKGMHLGHGSIRSVRSQHRGDWEFLGFPENRGPEVTVNLLTQQIMEIVMAYQSITEPLNCMLEKAKLFTSDTSDSTSDMRRSGCNLHCFTLSDATLNLTSAIQATPPPPPPGNGKLRTEDLCLVVAGVSGSDVISDPLSSVLHPGGQPT